MKKFLSLTTSILFGFALMAQMPQLPEILQEKLDEEHLDLTINYDETEQVKNEEDYYYYISRTMGSDTLLGYRWSEDAQNWMLQARIIKNYDDNEAVTEKYFQTLDDAGNWQNGLFFSYTYNSLGNQTELLIQHWMADSAMWVNHFKKESTYNDAGKLTEIQTSWWSFFNDDWFPHQRKVFTYSNDLLVADTISVHPWMMDAWMHHAYSSYDFYDNQLKWHKTVYFWKWMMNDWAQAKQFEYFWDDAGINISNVIMRQWAGDAGWKNEKKFNYTYTDFGELSNYTFEYWKSDAEIWVAKININYYYNSDNLLSEYVWQLHNWWSDQWVNHQQASYVYDVDGNMTETVVQKWNKWTEDWINWKKWEMILQYSAIMGVENPENNGISAVFANPYSSGSPIIFNGLENGNYTVKVFDVSGKLLKNEQINTESIFSLNGINKKGVYILTLTKNNSLLYKSKFIVIN